MPPYIGEVGSVTGASPRVTVDNCISFGGQSLKLMYISAAVCRLWPSVDLHYGRVFLPFLEVERPHYPAFDLLTVRGLHFKALRLRQLYTLHPRVEVCELLPLAFDKRVDLQWLCRCHLGKEKRLGRDIEAVYTPRRDSDFLDLSLFIHRNQLYLRPGSYE